ncbi:unnamed protein product, partial [marine sediment metagenome]
AVGAALVDKDPRIRALTADVLVEIGDETAVQVLVNGLSFRQAGNTAAAALDAVGWKPSTPQERILYLIGKGRKDELLADWDTTRYLLSKKLQSNRSQTIEYGINTFIALGEAEIIPKLLEFLEERGNLSIAELYLHSGREELVYTAEIWLDRNKATREADDNEDQEGLEDQWVLWGSME